MFKKILFLFVVLATSAVVSAGASAMPDDSCFRIATNRDSALANMGGELQWTGNRLNPCTGLKDSASTYYDLKGGVTQIRTVYGNGDSEGYQGLSRYWLCQDGRARVNQRIYGPVSCKNIPWGFWLFFPFDDDPSTWVKDKEICSTM